MDKMDRVSFSEVLRNEIRGVVTQRKFSADNQEALINCIIDANGGSTKINPRKMRQGTEVFELVEELINVSLSEGLKEEHLLGLVDYKNAANGDELVFVAEGESNFVVADAASGIQGVRRQRIEGGMSVAIPTVTKVLKVFENVGRLLAKRIDLIKFTDGIVKAYNQKIIDDAYTAIAALGATTIGLDSSLVKTGAYVENDFIALIEMVEALNGGAKAKIYGTRAALRRLTPFAESTEINSDYYNMGYAGKVLGTPAFALSQAVKPGTRDFALSNDRIYILCGDDKPIKFVTEGEGMLYEHDPSSNEDLTQEFVYVTSWGVGALCSKAMGIWNLA